MSFDETSWRNAERTIMGRLCAVTKTTMEKTAFIGYLPPAANLWAMMADTIADYDLVWAPCLSVVHLKVEIEGRWLVREDAQRFMMNVLSLGELRNVDNVTLFRLRTDGAFTLEPKWVQIPNTEKEVMVFEVKIGAELIFRTGA